MQIPVAELKVERTGSIHIGNGVLGISEMKGKDQFGPTKFLSLLNGNEGPKALFHICL